MRKLEDGEVRSPKAVRTMGQPCPGGIIDQSPSVSKAQGSAIITRMGLKKEATAVSGRQKGGEDNLLRRLPVQCATLCSQHFFN